MYQGLSFPTGARTLSWYMCHNATYWESNSTLTVNVSSVVDTISTSLTIPGTPKITAWTMYSLQFNIATAGTYYIQFRLTSGPNAGGFSILHIGDIVLT